MLASSRCIARADIPLELFKFLVFDPVNLHQILNSLEPSRGFSELNDPRCSFLADAVNQRKVIYAGIININRNAERASLFALNICSILKRPRDSMTTASPAESRRFNKLLSNGSLFLMPAATRRSQNLAVSGT